MIRALLAAAVLATSVGAFAQEGTTGTTAPTAAAPDTAAAPTTMKKKSRAECKKELGKEAKDKSAMKKCMSGN